LRTINTKENFREIRTEDLQHSKGRDDEYPGTAFDEKKAGGSFLSPQPNIWRK